MQKFLKLFHQDIDGGQISSELTRVPEFVKAHPEGAYRSGLFTGENQKGLFGPLVFVFAVKRARDLLLEGCDYQGMEIQVETGGRKLPQLPAVAELEKMLAAENTLVYVNGNPYKPATEVYGFQQVYDDSVKCIDSLRRLGLAQETMSLFATPEEISIEVHPGPLGIEGGNDTSELYYRLLCSIAEIKESAGKPLKTSIRTIVLQSVSQDYRLLLPGSNQPALHRPRVNVGASHFAYGIAAFSDYCAKKRTPQECLQETFNWVKFLQAELPPIAGLRDRIAQLPLLPLPGSGKPGAKVSAVTGSASRGRFQPLKIELEALQAGFAEPPKTLASVSPGLDRALGGGWSTGGLHVVVGPRESGKGSLLLQQALASEGKVPVLFISYEHGLREFALRGASFSGNVNFSDTLGALPVAGAAGEQTRKTLQGALSVLQTRISEKLFFTGCEANRATIDPEEIKQLASMLPAGPEKLILLESASLDSLLVDGGLPMRQLREIAAISGLTIILSVHAPVATGKRPHFIEEDDFQLLEKLQKYSDSILVLLAEKVNLRRFVAMVKGQIDASLVGSLEQKALQLAGGKRWKTDTYALARLIHTRSGRRDILLYLYQPDFMRFFELATMPLQRA